MKSIETYIASGVLELYVMGHATPAETAEVEQLATEHPAIRREIDSIAAGLEAYARLHAVAPRLTLKPLVLAKIDYLSRLQQGETLAPPPQLHPGSLVADYAPWLNRPDLQPPADFEEIHARIIGHAAGTTTILVWLRHFAEEEIHHAEHERFLIAAGTCDITVAGQVHHLQAGDYFAIPLHQPHGVQVTSATPCVAILQRIAV